MSSVTLILKHIPKSDYLSFEKPEKQFQESINNILKLCEKKYGYVCVTLEPPYKPRTTGEKSQNNLFWKLATIIAKETGSSLGEIESGLKYRALAKGYPYHINVVTRKPEPESMTKINTVEMGYLIDTAYEYIAELGIVLPPTVSKNEFDESLLEHREELKKESEVESQKMFANTAKSLATESLYDTEKIPVDEVDFY